MDHVETRSARKLVSPFVDRISPWQERLAHLRAMTLIGDKQDVAAQAAELLPLVIAARIEFEAAIESEPNGRLRSHSSVDAVRRSLNRLRDELETVAQS